VAPTDDPKNARPVTNDTYRGIRSYSWTHTNKHILYLQDKNGDENWRIFRVNLSSGDVKDLTPFVRVQARIESISYKYPQEIVVGLNNRDPEYHDLYRLNIETGNMTLIQKNTQFTGFSLDDDYNVRLATNMTPDGGVEVFKLVEGGRWEKFMEIGMEDVMATGFNGFDKTGDVVYMADSRGRNTAALYALNLVTGEKTLLAEDPKVDFGGFMLHPTKKNVQAVAFYYDRRRWEVLDPDWVEPMAYLQGLEEGDLGIGARSMDDMVWIVGYGVDDGPDHYYLYDRNKGKAVFLYSNIDALENHTLAKMTPAVIKSRDGLDLVSYYSLPPGSDKDGDLKPDKPMPMVLLVHGGPWNRDTWGL
jgi:dipeptidyl aminopeptidase/acylaminoacyl peptidase